MSEFILIEQITPQNIDNIILQILPYEPLCIYLTDLLKQQRLLFQDDEKLFVFLDSKIFYSNDGEFLGIVIISVNKVLLYCFPNEIDDKLEQCLVKYFKTIQIPTSIMGESNSGTIITNIIQNIFQVCPICSQNYKLLILKKLNPTSFYKIACDNVNSNLSILAPKLTDLDDLIPLEMDYQNTEVLTQGKKANIELCKKILSRCINKKQIIIAKIEKNIVAKVTINASGFFWQQIGGVYTSPKYRNKGIATALLEVMIKSKNNQKFVLFVKTKNRPALKIYEKLGFTFYCDFIINYF